MDKYIVEIDGKNICSDSDGKSKLALSVKADNGYAVFCTEIPLTPYIEPNLEQIKKEAYEQGQKDLRDSCVPQDEEAYGIGYNEGFQCGIDVTWDAARKIENLSEAEKFEIFGEYDMFHIMRRYTATEAIEKIRQYEQSQKELERVQKEKEKPISTEEVMRQYLDKFCKSHRCGNCALNTDDFTCGRGYYFTTIDGRVSDEEVRRAYAEVMKK